MIWCIFMMQKKLPINVVIGMLFITLLSIKGCYNYGFTNNATTPTLLVSPPPCEGQLLLITWFDSPVSASFEYEMLTLGRSGGLVHWHIQPNWAMRVVGIRQLTKKQLRTIQRTLTRMSSIPTGSLATRTTNMPTITSTTESQILTISFVWRGDSKVFLFDKNNCPSEFRDLLSVFDESLRQSKENNIFQNFCQSYTALSDTVTIPVTMLPTLGIHQAQELFCITWYKSPFDGSYDRLTLSASNFIYYQQVSDGQVNEIYSNLTDTERQEIQAALEILANTGSQRKKTEEILIVLNFPWEADYRLLTFGNSECPASLSGLLGIADTAIQRRLPESEDLYIPCLGEK